MKPIKTLVETMKETGWWPEDFDSEHEGETVGQVVVLERMDQLDNSLPTRWELLPQISYPTCPYPSNVYAMVCRRTTFPTFSRVLVAADKNPGKIDPLTDCCALVPFEPLIDQYAALTPKGRIELGQQAIAACLKLIGEWPFKTLPEIFPDDTRLEPGQRVDYDPAEWIIDGEDMLKNEFVRTYYMINTRAKLALTVVIAAGKENHPESIDPYRDCCAKFTYPKLGRRIGLFLRGAKAPAKHTIPDLERGAIAALLDSLGAWPPGRDINTNKPSRLEIRDLLQSAISKLMRFIPPAGTSPVRENLELLQSLLAKHKNKPAHNDTAYFIELFRTLNASLDEAISVEDADQAFARFLAAGEERLGELKGQNAPGYR
jgi:hypothetical protein